MPDLIVPQKTGLFCDPLDPESMADAISRVLDARAEAGARAAAAKADAERRFHPVAVARRHVEIYREVLQTRS